MNREEDNTPKRDDSESFKVLKSYQTRWNLLSMSFIWAVSGFVKYLLMYYSKYFPGSVFVNYSVQSLADVLCMYYIAIINKFFKDVRDILRFLLSMVIVFALV